VDKDGALYFTSVDGYFYALNADGSLRWRLRTGGITEASPIIDAQGMLRVGVNQGWWAVSAQGKKIWEKSEDCLAVSSPVALADGSTCFIAALTYLEDVGPDSQLKWRARLAPFCGGASPAVSASGTIYVAGVYRSLCAFRGAAPLANTPWPKFRCNLRNTGNVR
jgi:outer membrane protein assembly factor BamB